MLESQTKVTVRATADPMSAKIAQPIELRVRVEAPTPTPISFPELPDQWGPFQVIRATDATLQRSQRVNVWQKTWTLQCLQSGPQTIPAINIQAGDIQAGEVQAGEVQAGEVQAGEPTAVSTTPIVLEIESSLPEDRRSGPVDPAWIGPLEPPHELESSPRPTRNWTLPILVFTAIALVVALIWRRRTLRQSPRSQMLRELDELLIQSQESPTEAVIGLLDAWRRYLAAACNLPTAGMTALELVEAARTRTDDHVKTDVIRDCGSMAERSAYAGEPVSREKVIKLIERARLWVNAHRLMPIEKTPIEKTPIEKILLSAPHDVQRSR